MKKLVVLAVLALVVGLMTLGGSGQAVADPGTLFVAPTGSGGGSCATPDHNTIQDAIDAASAGETINVCPGTYTEDLSITTAAKNGLELAGAGSSSTTIVGVATVLATAFPLAVPNIDIKANDVSIHDFTIKSPVVAFDRYSSGIVLTGKNIEIYDNDFLVGTGDISQGIQTWKDANAPAGFRDISGLRIHHNKFSHLAPSTGNHAYEGIFINTQDTGFDPTDPSKAVRIDHNKFFGKLIRAVATERSETVIDHNKMSTDRSTIFTVFPRGIELRDGSYHSVTDNKIDDKGLASFYTGIMVKADASDSVIGDSGNKVKGATDNGIEVNGDRNTIKHNKVEKNGGNGIYVDGDDNALEKNRAKKNGGDGIHVAGDGNSFEENESEKNGGDGIHVAGDSNTFEENESEKNGGDGIRVAGDGNSFEENESEKNGGDGIHVAGDGNTFEENESEKNDGDGIYVAGDGNTFEENESEKNDGDGIYVEGDGNTLEKNKAKKNGGDGFEAASSSSGNAFTENKADKNTGFGYNDGSTGGGTAGTDNTYTNNKCKNNTAGGSNPAGLCTP